MAKNRIYTWTVDKPQVEKILKGRRDTLIDTATNYAASRGMTSVVFGEMAEHLFPLEILKAVRGWPEEPDGNASYVDYVVEFSGNPDILRNGMDLKSQEFLSLDSHARTLKFHVHLPVNLNLAATYLQHVKDYLEDFNEVIISYRTTEIERLRKRLIDSSTDALRAAGIAELKTLKI